MDACAKVSGLAKLARSSGDWGAAGTKRPPALRTVDVMCHWANGPVSTKRASGRHYARTSCRRPVRHGRPCPQGRQNRQSRQSRSTVKGCGTDELRGPWALKEAAESDALRARACRSQVASHMLVLRCKWASQNVLGLACFAGRLKFDPSEASLVELLVPCVQYRDHHMAFHSLRRTALHGKFKLVKKAHGYPHDSVFVLAFGRDGLKYFAGIGQAGCSVQTDAVVVRVPAPHSQFECVGRNNWNSAGTELLASYTAKEPLIVTYRIGLALHRRTMRLARSAANKATKSGI